CRCAAIGLQIRRAMPRRENADRVHRHQAAEYPCADKCAEHQSDNVVPFHPGFAIRGTRSGFVLATEAPSPQAYDDAGDGGDGAKGGEHDDDPGTHWVDWLVAKQVKPMQPRPQIVPALLGSWRIEYHLAGLRRDIQGCRLGAFHPHLVQGSMAIQTAGMGPAVFVDDAHMMHRLRPRKIA